MFDQEAKFKWQKIVGPPPLLISHKSPHQLEKKLDLAFHSLVGGQVYNSEMLELHPETRKQQKRHKGETKMCFPALRISRSYRPRHVTEKRVDPGLLFDLPSLGITSLNGWLYVEYYL